MSGMHLNMVKADKLVVIARKYLKFDYNLAKYMKVLLI